MPRLPWPRRRRYRILLALGGVVALYLIALSAVPALFSRDETAGRREQALRAIDAANWGLVEPKEREALGQAVDSAWRALQSYHMTYLSGTPEGLAAGRFESRAESTFRLARNGHIAAQRDSSFVSAASPASSGRDEQMEGYRVLTREPYVNSRGRRVSDAELVYQRSLPGAWVCERVAADKKPPPSPGLDFASAGDAGFSEIDGQRVRGFRLASGAFGLRSEATVWIEVETLRVRRQEIDSALRGRREVWTYEAFDQPVEIVPPTGIVCQDT